MRRTIDNAFSGGEPNYGRSLASSLAPMQARLDETPFGFALELSPMRAFDALRLWPGLSEHEEAQAMLHDVAIAPARRMAAAGISPDLTLVEIAGRLGIRIIDAFDGDALVMEPEALRELVGMIDTISLRSVLVDGPIERRDAEAMAVALAKGRSPLLAELRALAAIEVRDDSVVELHTRTRVQALSLVAENFRHYIAALRRRSANEIAAPEAWQLERIFGISGSLCVRPIETDMFSTSVDVGISTALEHRPADRSLIYDLPSNTWHDEP